MIDFFDLPNKSMLRIDEVATFFDVSEKTIRRWIDHEQFEVKKIKNTIRICRDSVISFDSKIKKARKR